MLFNEIIPSLVEEDLANGRTGLVVSISALQPVTTITE